MLRSFLLLSLLFFALAASAQDTPERQPASTGGQVVVIEDQGKPQNSNTPASGTTGQTTENRSEQHPVANPDQPLKPEAGNATEAGKEGDKQEEARPEAPRVRRVYKKDTTRRVVLRRRTKGGTGSTAARELRDGYRIQIFTGGNRRQDRMRAEALGERVRQYFPELSTYSHFVCPRWTCRVGDFEKPEQANRYVSLILRSKVSVEARVIKCKVWLPKK